MSISATDNDSATNSSSVNVFSSTQRNASCGQVTNVIIQGGGGGVVGPQGERGPPGPAGPDGETGLTGPAGNWTSRTRWRSRITRTKRYRVIVLLRIVFIILLSIHAGPPGTNIGGVAFTRWGTTTCPNTEGPSCCTRELRLELVMTKQGVRNTCAFITVQSWRSYLEGISREGPTFNSMNYHDAPCAVCYAPTRIAKITVSGRIACHPSWTREYYGYLMADQYHTPPFVLM